MRRHIVMAALAMLAGIGAGAVRARPRAGHGGQKEAARAEYDRTLAIDPNFIRARTARDAL